MRLNYSKISTRQSSKKRVLFLMQSNTFAGAEKRIFDILGYLDYSKVDVTLCLSENHIPASLSCRHPDVKIATFRPADKGGWTALLRTYRPGQVVFCKTWISNFSLACLLAAWAYTRGDIHLIEFSEAPQADTVKMWLGCLPGLGLWKWKYFLKARLVKSVITMSQVLKERLVSDYFYPSARVHVAYANIDWDKFRPRIKKDFVKRRALGIPDDAAVIITAGRLCRDKAIDKSIAAFAGVWQETGRKDVWLWVLGRGCEERELRGLAEKSGVKDRVLFLGFQADIERYFQESDIFIHTADNEASGTVFVEAVATGLLCLLTDSNCGAGEYFRGYPYNVENTIPALTKALNEVLGMDKETLKSFALEFRREFLKEYCHPRWDEREAVKRAWRLPTKDVASFRRGHFEGADPQGAFGRLETG